jgi:hypothetical protein
MLQLEGLAYVFGDESDPIDLFASNDTLRLERLADTFGVFHHIEKSKQ